MKTYNIRLFPTLEQIDKLNQLSSIRLSIYNHYLNLNIENYKVKKKIFNAYQMHKMFTADKKEYVDWQILNTKCVQTILTKLYDNYKSFFTLIKKDKSSKPPQIIENINQFKTISFNQSGWSVKPNNIILINQIPIEYKSIYNLKKLNIKEIRVKFIRNKWLCDLVVEDRIELPSQKLIENKVLSLDLGLEKLATGIDSNGKIIVIYNKPKKISKYFHKRIDIIKSKQAKCFKKSRRWKHLQIVKNKLYHRKNSQVKECLHIETKKLVNMNYNTIIIGDLKVKKLMELEKNKYKKISRSFGRTNLAMFIDFLTYKGRDKYINVVKVDERHTTQQNCLTGKLFDKKIELKDRIVRLSNDVEIDRDLNSAINIYNRWYNNHLAVLTPPLDLSSVLIKNNILIREPTVL
jgi:putative transposase